MAKTKKKKKSEEKKFEHWNEVIGLFLIVVSILSIVPTPLGIIGELGASFAMFLIGTWYQVLLLFVFFLGCYMVYKRELPDFFTRRMIGLYLLMAGLLVLEHTTYVKTYSKDVLMVFQVTVDNLVANFQHIMDDTALTLKGAGVIGALFSVAFYKLFALEGTYIVSILFLLVSIAMLTGFDIVSFITKPFKRSKKKKKPSLEETGVIVNDSSILKEELEKEESSMKEEPSMDNKIRIHSIDELTHAKEHTIESSTATEGTIEVGEPQKEVQIHDHTNRNYQLPSLSLLSVTKKGKNGNNNEIIEANILKLEKVLKEMTPDEVIDEIKKSGLRGRGGAGFPTGNKWELTKAAVGEQKYVVCNADEGDPGAFMDRSILEGDPHSVLESMIIAGYAIGADKGYIYVRAEYPIAVHRFQIAIDEAREYGILGKNIFGSSMSFDVEIRLGAGAFVCGEETALLESIEGKRGQPRVKPPYPAQCGLWGKPTLINNVETFANITRIILNGAQWYSSIGTEKSKGTKVFALGGNVNNIGLVEVPMGTTLREIVYDIGGGIPNRREFKAAQTGGPSGGCIPKEHLDTPIDYESLKEIGSMMGSGGMIIMDDTKCMVSLAKFYLEFTVSESCGKCTPCRIGTKRMLEILQKLCDGKGEEMDIYRLEKLALNIQRASICGLGQSAPNPVISAMKYFREEFKEHAIDKTCRTLECKAISKIMINEEKCKGCGLCQRACPVNAIEGKDREKRVINQDKCIKCGTCLTNCPFKAIGN